MPEEEQKQERGIKVLNFKMGGRRISSYIVGALIGGIVLYGLKWVWNSYSFSTCLKCLLPNAILTSSVAVTLTAIINEVFQIVMGIKK